MHLFTKSRVATRGRRNLIAILGVVALMLLCALLLRGADSLASNEPQADHAQRPVAVRIGTYDSRAIAVAYIRSDQSAQNMKELLRQRADAQKKGDKKLLDTLNAQGEAMQVRNHLQGFSTAPVDDILALVTDKLPGVAQQKNIVAIARAADYHEGIVELVDITDELVLLFNPTKETLKVIVDLRKQKPLPIEDVAKMPSNK